MSEITSLPVELAQDDAAGLHGTDERALQSVGVDVLARLKKARNAPADGNAACHSALAVGGDTIETALWRGGVVAVGERR